MSKMMAWLLVMGLIVTDYLSKWWVETALPFHEKVDLIPFWAFFRTHNEGIAFSLLAGANDWLLVVLTLAIIGFVIWLWANSDGERMLSQVGYAFIVGGAAGNLVDRIFLGYVVDFILFYTENWSFAVFNLADSFISVGAAAIILDEVLDFRRHQGEKS